VATASRSPEPPQRDPVATDQAEAATRPARHVIVAPGVAVPYPHPASPAATAIGKANRRVNTKPELAVRSALHRRGLRFRKDHRLQANEVRVRVDVVFSRRRVAVFIDGCFWHGCPEHQTVPKRNLDYWGPKLAANKTRDERVNRALRAEGWEVIRVWEHEDPEIAAEQIEDVVKGR
jgi:DNA mismatch endonuclease, patch repair protein